MNDFDLFIDVTNKYYNGENTGMSDKEYDELEKRIKSQYPNFNKFDHLNCIQGLRVNHHDSFQPQDYKISFESTEELIKLLESVDGEYYLTYKYDGCSIRAYYKDGELFDIITRSDEFTGIRQLSKLKNKIPNKVDKSVKFIDFEAVTSKEDFGEDSRSKSNGLVNSKYLQDQVDQYLVLIPFKVTSTKTVNYKEAMELVFNLDELPKCTIEDFDYDSRFINYKNKHYPIDGIVIYYPDKLNHGIYKFYSSEDLSTEVTNIVWSLQNNGSYTPKIQFNPIKISGRTIRQATSNGYARLSSIKAGIGSKITVILANSTIPQVHNVLVPSEDYNIPDKCEYCGGKIGIINNKLRCLNDRCKVFYNWITNGVLDNITPEDCHSLNTDINNIEELREKVAYYKKEGLINLDRSLFGKSLINSITLERFSEGRKTNLILFINDNIDYLIDKGFKNYSSELSYFMSWNQWCVFEGYLTIIDEVLQVLYKE